MKISAALALTIAVTLMGCGEKSPPSAAPTNTPISPHGDYLSTITRAEQSAFKTVDTTALASAIQMFQVDKGRWPKDLNELVVEKFIAKLPEAPIGSRIAYDPHTGTVTLLKQ